MLVVIVFRTDRRGFHTSVQRNARNRKKGNRKKQAKSRSKSMRLFHGSQEQLRGQSKNSDQKEKKKTRACNDRLSRIPRRNSVRKRHEPTGLRNAHRASRAIDEHDWETGGSLSFRFPLDLAYGPITPPYTRLVCRIMEGC